MEAGLCASCVHAKTIVSDRGVSYLQCRLALEDPRFPKYPRLPVLQCEGYRPLSPEWPLRRDNQIP